MPLWEAASGVPKSQPNQSLPGKLPKTPLGAPVGSGKCPGRRWPNAALQQLFRSGDLRDDLSGHGGEGGLSLRSGGHPTSVRWDASLPLRSSLYFVGNERETEHSPSASLSWHMQQNQETSDLAQRQSAYFAHKWPQVGMCTMKEISMFKSGYQGAEKYQYSQFCRFQIAG